MPASNISPYASYPNTNRANKPQNAPSPKLGIQLTCRFSQVRATPSSSFWRRIYRVYHERPGKVKLRLTFRGNDQNKTLNSRYLTDKMLIAPRNEEPVWSRMPKDCTLSRCVSRTSGAKHSTRVGASEIGSFGPAQSFVMYPSLLLEYRRGNCGRDACSIYHNLPGLDAVCSCAVLAVW